jgi:hypothetical protein
MSSVPNPPPPEIGGIPGLEPRPRAARGRRHALGLPAGSIRALLALMIVGMICVLMLVSPLQEKPIRIPPYLIYLLFMVLGHFYAAHGHSIGRPDVDEASPLYLPRGFVRLFILGLLVATIAWEFWKDAEGFHKQLVASTEELPKQPFLPIVLLGGFFLGILIHMLVGRDNQSYWFQDFEAWVALLAVLGLCIDALIYLVISPSLKERDPLETSGLQAFVAALVAFYFGARS